MYYLNYALILFRSRESLKHVLIFYITQVVCSVCLCSASQQVCQLWKLLWLHKHTHTCAKQVRKTVKTTKMVVKIEYMSVSQGSVSQRMCGATVQRSFSDVAHSAIACVSSKWRVLFSEAIYMQSYTHIAFLCNAVLKHMFQILTPCQKFA